MHLIGPETLAERWGVPISWVYMKCRAGALPYLKLGRYVRFDVDELEGWVAQHHRGATPSTTAQTRRLRAPEETRVTHAGQPVLVGSADEKG